MVKMGAFDQGSQTAPLSEPPRCEQEHDADGGEADEQDACICRIE